MAKQQAPLIILSGASGSGKSTLIRRLLDTTKLPLRVSVSVTTRLPRPGEIDGQHYHFWNKERFQRECTGGGFLEWAEVHGNYYGTLREEVEPYRDRGIGVILAIDVRGAAQVRQRCPEAVSVFVRTSTPAAYEERLRQRGTETEEETRLRLKAAQWELEQAGAFDYQLLNDDLDRAVVDLEAFVASQFGGGRNAG